MNRLGNTLSWLVVALIILFSGSLLSLAAERASISVEVNRPGHQIAPTLWGIFFEDINLSADGGIYPELVRNRSFEDGEKPESWTLDCHQGYAEMEIDTRHPLNPFNRRSLRLDLDGNASLSNAGYWGMALVKGERYHLRLAARATGFNPALALALRDPSGSILAEGTIQGITDRWKHFDLDLTALETQPKARLDLQVNGEGILWLDMVSILPAKTWKGHGLRPDLCEMLDAMRPSFMRFPGGCWVEGDDMAHMYNWKKTIGDTACRQPLWNIWGYWATHGLGYHEYLQLSEDLGAEPLFCVNTGMSHKENVPLDQMGPWIQDALDAIEYANGPASSVWGRVRARNGHPAPFNLKYVEIGNENGGPAYQERYPLLYRAIKERYPEIHLIANDWGGVPTNAPVEIIDEHYYNSPEFFIQQAGKYDTYSRTGPKIFVGEYAVTQGCGQGNLRGAIGEAAFMTGLERNSDVVIMASYAPLFVNANHRRWNPDLINFDSARVYGLPSYYVQQLFSVHRGDAVLPVKVQSPTTTITPKGGAVGVGTWRTQAEFKDLKITRGNETLWSCNFAEGTNGWKLLGGDWKVEDGVLRQNQLEENVRAIFPSNTWTEFTYSLKARKLSGEEGFLVLFNVTDDAAKSWWNIGGWGNQRHAIEVGGLIGREASGSVQTNRWYDLRIEVSGRMVKCYMDDQLITQGELPVLHSLYASASLDQKQGETIVKVVNVAPEPVETDIKLAGVSTISGPAQGFVLASDQPTDENSLEHPTRVAPRKVAIEVKSPEFSHTFPGNSLTILRFNTAH